VKEKKLTQAWALQEHGLGRSKRAELVTGGYGSGISVEIGKTKGTLYISGYYDGMVGIEGGELSLRDLLQLFPKATLRKAVKGLL